MSNLIFASSDNFNKDLDFVTNNSVDNIDKNDVFFNYFFSKNSFQIQNYKYLPYQLLNLIPLDVFICMKNYIKLKKKLHIFVNNDEIWTKFIWFALHEFGIIIPKFFYSFYSNANILGLNLQQYIMDLNNYITKEVFPIGFNALKKYNMDDKWILRVLSNISPQYQFDVKFNFDIDNNHYDVTRYYHIPKQYDVNTTLSWFVLPLIYYVFKWFNNNNYKDENLLVSFPILHSTALIYSIIEVNKIYLKNIATIEQLHDYIYHCLEKYNVKTIEAVVRLNIKSGEHDVFHLSPRDQENIFNNDDDGNGWDYISALAIKYMNFYSYCGLKKTFYANFPNMMKI